jgi:hypothetical protein
MAATAAAQTLRQSTIRVHVTDSAGVPVAGADVSIVRGLADVAAHAVTDAQGVHAFSFLSSGKDAELIVRKIGFSRVSRFFADTLVPSVVEIKLARSARSLDTVKVAEREDPVRKSYFIDADAIENSPRLVTDGLDVVMKLRPDMIWSRTGKPDRIAGHVTMKGRVIPPRAQTELGVTFGDCGAPANRPVANIWVNGSRIGEVDVNRLAMLRRVDDGIYISAQIATVLASIKPEHIAEMQYHPCTESQPDAPPHTLNAIMVQLKEGIGFDPGVGSYILPTRVNAVAGAAPAPVATPASATAGPLAHRPLLVGVTPADTLPAARILGVFDDGTGDPIADAEVVDVATGTRARTTETGTVALWFLPPGESQLKIQRAGYAAKTLDVVISTDAVPITVLLARAGNPPARQQ